MPCLIDTDWAIDLLASVPEAVQLLAATALEYNLTLVTRNNEDYADIPGVKLYRPS